MYVCGAWDSAQWGPSSVHADTHLGPTSAAPGAPGLHLWTRLLQKANASVPECVNRARPCQGMEAQGGVYLGNVTAAPAAERLQRACLFGGGLSVCGLHLLLEPGILHVAMVSMCV